MSLEEEEDFIGAFAKAAVTSCHTLCHRAPFDVVSPSTIGLLQVGLCASLQFSLSQHQRKLLFSGAFCTVTSPFTNRT